MKIVDLSVDRKITVTMITLIVILGGIISFTKLGLDMLPDVEFPMVSVVTVYSGASPEDIESIVTKPIEQAIASVSGVKGVVSTTVEGMSMIAVEFESGSNLDFAAQDLRDQLAMFADFLPDDIQTPLVMKFDMSALPLLFYGVTSEERPLNELAEYMDESAGYRLERIEGVASVIVQSPEVREIQVEIDQHALETSGITLDQVIQMIGFENLNMPAGRIVEDHKDFLVRTRAEFASLTELEDLIVGASPTGNPIKLRQVAKVKDTVSDLRTEMRVQSKPGVMMIVTKQSGANTVRVADAVKAELADLQQVLPEDIEMHIGMDMSSSVKLTVNSTGRTAMLGGFLAMLMIYFFLRNIRPTLAVGIAIPVSIVVTFIPLNAVGYTLNLLTLGGLALGIGMLVDNAIVVIENVFRHLEEGKSRKEAARLGASEVGMAITASTLTTLAVFLPMAMGSGTAGQLVRGLALSISFSLLASLFVSLTMVPMIASVFFKPRSKVDYTLKADESWIVRLRAVYTASLTIVLQHRGKTLGAATALFIISMALIPVVGTEFMPEMDQAMLMMKIKLPVGSALEETDQAVRQVEKIALSEDAVQTVIVSNGVNEEDRGQSGDMANAGSHEGMIMLAMKPKSERSLSTTKIGEKIRGEIPAMRDVTIQSIDFGAAMGGSGADVEIQVFGKDFVILEEISKEVAAIIADVEGVMDIKSSMEEAKPEYHIALNREEINRMGLVSGQVANTIKASTLGQVATRYRFAGDETNVRIKFREDQRNSIRDIGQIKLTTPMKSQIPLAQVASITQEEGPVKIVRDNQSRMVLVTASILDRDMGSVMEEIIEILKPIQSTLPDGYFVEYGGQYEQMIDTFITLGQALALAILLVFMVMASQFESLIHPFVIMVTIPLALIGVVIGFLVSGVTISLTSFIGFIMLTGIVVNNGIVLVDYINQLRRKGVEATAAIIEAGSTRLRPVLITALTTIFGMLPMVLDSSEGAEMRAPMAITVIGGLTAATFLTLFVVPSLYSLLADAGIRRAERKQLKST
ncbi:MAG: efflux RND transporter permease subunit [Candidatus Marinimicrobia bacterium]|jgi:hydrophobic/amphiphilic exporter-1 (mainly G- bacteria), HAE1 family|nr:efflux RND transporter permease subunit [Candidatus Neomarinimicrobiota bacterium]MBT3681409.1 efflux RND transporter permease subunit [Candidatus Neomarinimicrobiota bacterium]MBT3952243.1 efflux RND transporter permease subunit [Candidatus Neomarinimicrobiota bacterium]MBT4254388.1 efflux RND transporter permease subunit [Candidatus Neomarinimicrobiota bacterium]MBT4420955.1 efflux RND transporter permease subunit [Candidatus Neomarinimicrobiota bacterium]